MNSTRREFIGGALAACAAPGVVVGAESRPNLVFGVLTDVHIGGRKGTAEVLKRTLEWFAQNRVDAVLCAGDVAHSGRISQLQVFADAWQHAFPNSRGIDGGKVDLMMSTGNHEFPSWKGCWSNMTAEQLRKESFPYDDNPQRVWDRLFGIKWEQTWRHEVKGYTFIGSQWSFTPPIEQYMNEHGKELDPKKPFFYCQHPHPQGTCHGSYAGSSDRGQSTRAFANYPNAVCFTGHSHCSIVDERTVWQGNFTSIGAGCMHEGGGSFSYDNVSAKWHPSFKKRIMAPIEDPEAWGGDPLGGCCELVEVFDDHLIVHRHSTMFGCPLGRPWIVPLPAQKGGPFDFAARAKTLPVPQFPKGAKVELEVCSKGHPYEGVAFKGVPCLYVKFPHALTKGEDGRVFDYLVTASVKGQPVAKAKLFAAGCTRPERRADVPGEYLFALKDLPAGKPVVVTAVPRNCFAKEGAPISSVPHMMPAAT